VRRTGVAAAAAAVCAAAAALGCAAKTSQPVQIAEGRRAMGTILEITLVASDEATARALIERCFAETERLERIFTTWREDGELARLNAKAGLGPQQASPELVSILRDARSLGGEGAFDVTVGPLVRLWREAETRGAPPSAADIAAARARLGSARIGLDAEENLITLESGMSIDLGGIAKGWTLDRLVELLRLAGTPRALLNFGGSSLAALGAPLDATRWRVSAASEVLDLLPGANVSISGSFGQVVEIGGARFSHIIDPRTGLPVRRELRAIVRAPTGASAEVWSTALVVLFASEECTPGREQVVTRASPAGDVTATVSCAP
jgi:thiamine biosynthesis lipoprotein